MITLSGIEKNILTEFIAAKKKPPGIPIAKWGTCLLSLTNVSDEQIAEALGKSTGAIRSIRFRNKDLVGQITDEFTNHFITEAEKAFKVATDVSLAWMKDPSGQRPNMWRSAFNVYDLIHPRVTAKLLETILNRGLIHLLPFLPVEDGLNDFMRGIFRKGLYDSLREFVEHGGDKDLALASLALLEKENLSN